MVCSAPICMYLGILKQIKGPQIPHDICSAHQFHPFIRCRTNYIESVVEFQRDPTIIYPLFFVVSNIFSLKGISMTKMAKIKVIDSHFGMCD